MRNGEFHLRLDNGRARDVACLEMQGPKKSKNERKLQIPTKLP